MPGTILKVLHAYTERLLGKMRKPKLREVRLPGNNETESQASSTWFLLCCRREAQEQSGAGSGTICSLNKQRDWKTHFSSSPSPKVSEH